MTTDNDVNVDADDDNDNNEIGYRTDALRQPSG